MKYTLLENGIDSLKGSYNSLEKLPELQEGIEHNVKDAVLNLNHAIEILFKLILKNQQEYLIFTDLDKYMKAKEKMFVTNKQNVLEANPNLRTVTLHEAISRAELLCDIKIPTEFKTAINYINDKRNQITHYEIILTENEVKELIDNLKVCYELSVEFFENKLGNVFALLEEARFEITVQEHYEELAEVYGEMAYEDAKLDALMEAYENE